MKAELVLNLGEIDMSEWEDQKDKKVIASKMMDGQTIHYRASRNVRHISIITCIIASGEPLTPYIVPSHDSAPVCRRLMSRGVCLRVDFMSRQRLKSYISDKLFLEYFNSIFVLYLNERRESEEFEACEACEAALLMDICSPHMSNDIVAVFTPVRMRIITFARHTTHIFQMLNA
jgi:hypothetical protein